MSQEGMAGMRATVTHFADLLGILASAIGGTLSTDLGIERLNDAHVASWSSGQVVAYLERQQAALLPQLEPLQEEPTASTRAAARPRAAGGNSQDAGRHPRQPAKPVTLALTGPGAGA
jgi:hypothetical protein